MLKNYNFLLSNQIKAGICFDSSTVDENACRIMECDASEKQRQFISQLPAIRVKLHTDVMAAFNGDPAAKFCKVIFCYPSIRTISNYQYCQRIYTRLNVPIIPRIITENGSYRNRNGHPPRATIGDTLQLITAPAFVIGETTIIGDSKNVSGHDTWCKSFTRRKRKSN